jgi:carbon monoxide dehydrogenase subunit G
LISITEQIVVPSPRERVWAVISDPAQVVSCISGADLGEAHDDGSFDATLSVKFATVRVRFAARVSLDLTPVEHEGRLSARGRDGQGATRFSAQATFQVREGTPAGTSLVELAGQIQLNGKLAGLVEAGAQAVVARMTRDFTAQLIARCAEPVAGLVLVPETARPSAESDSRAGLLTRLRTSLWARIPHPFTAKTKETPRAQA